MFATISGEAVSGLVGGLALATLVIGSGWLLTCLVRWDNENRADTERLLRVNLSRCALACGNTVAEMDANPAMLTTDIAKAVKDAEVFLAAAKVNLKELG